MSKLIVASSEFKQDWKHKQVSGAKIRVVREGLNKMK